MDHTPRRINTLASSTFAKKYLEIGVSAGATFRQVNINEKTGVDPSFAFDINSELNEFTRFAEMTSDEFFLNEPIFPFYDFVFIDGLHTFEQVVRDFSNVFARTHRKSLILIDDTFPSDVFSSLPDETRTQKFRKFAGSEGNDWHGDVFKFVAYLHDFWPCLEFITIMGSGNPQTLVWRSNSTNRTPKYNSLERISRMTYFDLLDNLDLLNQGSEGEAVSACISGLSRL